MINFLAATKTQITIVSIAAALLLQGCGAERTTDFNPDTSASSSSSSAPKVSVEQITQGTDPYMVQDYSDKRLQVAREEDDFFEFKNSYTTTLTDTPNFTKGQVVLVDMGEQDSCKQHLEFNSLRAEEAGSEAVKVVISYTAKAAVSATTTCTSVKTRPFYFYYVDSRDQLIFAETVL